MEARRPVVVFDLDHTLVDTNVRIVALIREIGEQLSLPNLASVQSEQIEALRLGREDALGPLTPKQYSNIFGLRSDGSNKQSLFGRRFYFDSSYLRHDTMIPGAAEFVGRVRTELGGDVLYLSGRIDEIFREATLAQLKRFGFPDAELILKPAAHVGDMDQWKLGILKSIAKHRPIVALFDDSKRNANLFAAEFPRAQVVRVTRDVSNRNGLHKRIEQITNYLENFSGVGAHRTVKSNQAQLERILRAAKKCASWLENKD